MATNFFRTYVDDYSFIRGAARLMIAPITQPFPDEINDVIALAPTPGQDDVQTLTPSGAASAGTFTISAGADTTSAIAYNATAAAIQTDLEALADIGAGNVACTGGPISTTPVVVTFGGTLADTYQAVLTIDDAAVVGGTIAVAHTTPGGADLNLYDAQTGWSDLGATKTGITLSINNSEDTFTIDQQLGIIGSEPSGWTCTVGSALAEVTPERLQVAWQGSLITVNNTPVVPEKQIGFGAPNFYIQRRMAVLFQRPSGLIRAYMIRIAQRSPQESSLTHAPTGDQQSIPILFNCLADTSVVDTQQQFFMIYDQAQS